MANHLSNIHWEFQAKDAVDSVTSPRMGEEGGSPMGALCLLCMDYIWRTVILALARLMWDFMYWKYLQHTCARLVVLPSSLSRRASSRHNSSGAVTLPMCANLSAISFYIWNRNIRSSSFPKSFNLPQILETKGCWKYDRQGHLNWTLIYSNTENSCELNI